MLNEPNIKCSFYFLRPSSLFLVAEPLIGYGFNQLTEEKGTAG